MYIYVTYVEQNIYFAPQFTCLYLCYVVYSNLNQIVAGCKCTTFLKTITFLFRIW